MGILGSDKGKKTTLAGVAIFIVVASLIVLMAMDKLDSQLGGIITSITGLVTAIGLWYAKDSDK